MNKSCFVTAASLTAILTACANFPDHTTHSSQSSLLIEYPEAIILPIGVLPIQNKNYNRVFDQYPVRALKNFPREAPKIGCAMIEVLIGKDGHVKKATVTESYPKSVFDIETIRDASESRYAPQSTEVITYQFYQFEVDRFRDTGVVRISRLLGTTKVVLERKFEEFYTTGNSSDWGKAPQMSAKMPKQCKTLYNRYTSL